MVSKLELVMEYLGIKRITETYTSREEVETRPKTKGFVNLSIRKTLLSNKYYLKLVNCDFFQRQI